MEVNTAYAANYQKEVQKTTAAQNVNKVVVHEELESTKLTNQVIALNQSTKTTSNNDNTPSAKQEAEKNDESEQLEKAVKFSNAILKSSNRRLQISVHEKSHRVMVKVIDSANDKVIREIPPESVLDNYVKMLELAGIMIDIKS